LHAHGQQEIIKKMSRDSMRISIFSSKQCLDIQILWMKKLPNNYMGTNSWRGSNHRTTKAKVDILSGTFIQHRLSISNFLLQWRV